MSEPVEQQFEAAMYELIHASIDFEGESTRTGKSTVFYSKGDRVNAAKDRLREMFANSRSEHEGGPA